MMRSVMSFALLGSVLSTTIVGCKSNDRVAHGGFSQIRQNSSTEADVVAALGQPEHKMPGLWIYQRPEQHLYVKIEFDESGLVTRKEWIDGATGGWEDTNDAKPAKP